MPIAVLLYTHQHHHWKSNFCRVVRTSTIRSVGRIANMRLRSFIWNSGKTLRTTRFVLYSFVRSFDRSVAFQIFVCLFICVGRTHAVAVVALILLFYLFLLHHHHHHRNWLTLSLCFSRFVLIENMIRIDLHCRFYCWADRMDLKCVRVSVWAVISWPQFYVALWCLDLLLHYTSVYTVHTCNKKYRDETIQNENKRHFE